MAAVGVTGHRDLPTGCQSRLAERLKTSLARLRDRWPGDSLEAWSVLAAGADQIFAQAALDAGWTLVAVIPAMDYREGWKGQDRDEFDRLVNLASRVISLAYERRGPDAYRAAGELLIEQCDLLIAVYSGRPSRAAGDTADIVALARLRKRELVIIDPADFTIV